MKYLVTYKNGLPPDEVPGVLLNFDRKTGNARFDVGSTKALVLTDVEDVSELQESEAA